MSAYYNEIDKHCAHWLECLMRAGLIPAGVVDTRPIQQVHADELREFAQCHFFAGIGGWARAARLAGWPDDRPLWTGSCPCQPFSQAGQRKGKDDKRHLWPYFHRLIRAGRPACIMGEQVAGAAGYAWFDGVAACLEGEGYACRAVDIPACAVNAPHIRSRLYWVAYSKRTSRRAEYEQDAGTGPHGRKIDGAVPWQVSERLSGMEFTSESRLSVSEREELYGARRRQEGRAVAESGGADSSLADSGHGQLPEPRREPEGRDGSRPVRAISRWLADAGHLEGRTAETRREEEWRTEHAGGIDGMEYSDFSRPSEGRLQRSGELCGLSRDPQSNPWDDWILVGPDPKGKYRRLRPGLRLLPHGIPGRVAQLRGLGNAIVPEEAAEVMLAWMETAP